MIEYMLYVFSLALASIVFVVVINELNWFAILLSIIILSTYAWYLLFALLG